jgi:hypothetical protein
MVTEPSIQSVLEEASNSWALQMIFGIVIVVMQLIIVALGAVLWFMASRLMKIVDALPDKFAKTHQRVSEVENNVARHGVRLENLERTDRRP